MFTSPQGVGNGIRCGAIAPSQVNSQPVKPAASIVELPEGGVNEPIIGRRFSHEECGF
jgi:hypothetical protein